MKRERNLVEVEVLEDVTSLGLVKGTTVHMTPATASNLQRRRHVQILNKGLIPPPQIDETLLPVSAEVPPFNETEDPPVSTPPETSKNGEGTGDLPPIEGDAGTGGEREETPTPEEDVFPLLVEDEKADPTPPPRHKLGTSKARAK